MGFKTADGVQIVADYYPPRPAGPGKAPAAATQAQTVQVAISGMT